jgi:ClpP class serine protease
MNDHALLSPDTLWAMAPRALESALRQLHGARTDATELVGSDSALQAAVSGRNIEPMAGTRTAGIWRDVAVIPVRGMIRPIHSWYSGTSLRSLAHDITAALDDSGVGAIVLDIDSPGGQVTGLDEISDLIHSARGKKPIIAHCGGGMVASAALWIASACDKVVLTASAEIGSIGVVATFVDWAAYEDKLGIKEIEIVSSQSPRKRPDPATDDGRAQIQERIDSIADVFIDHVARNYGVSRDRVLTEFGQGDLLVGEKAVAVGLANRLQPFDDLMGQLASARRMSSAFPMATGANPMPSKETGTPTAPETSALTVESLKAQHPEIAQALIDEGKQAGAAGEQSRIKGILEQSVEGLEEFVLEAAFDAEQTPEKVAVACMKKIKAGEVTFGSRSDLEAPLAGGSQDPTPQSEQNKAPVIDLAKVYSHVNGIGRKA